MEDDERLKTIARILATHVMDMDRCEFIENPKNAPCCAECSCWENALVAADAVLEYMDNNGLSR